MCVFMKKRLVILVKSRATVAVYNWNYFFFTEINRYMELIISIILNKF